MNVPFLDDWGLVSFFDKVASGKANFGDFFAQHFEHRLLFPRIIFSILAFSSSWNVKLEQLCSLFLAIGSFYALYQISANQHNNNKLLFHLVNISSCILFFSLVQYPNWLWGFQLAWYLINACVILSIFILAVPKNLSPYLRVFLAALCCFIASFSLAHGLMSWIALIPTVAFIESAPKQNKIIVFIWVMLFISCCAIYTIGYQKLDVSADLLFFVKKPLLAVTFLLMIVGSSIGQMINPGISGLVIIIIVLFLNVYYFKNYKTEFARDAAPWLSLGWFATLFILITTIGRVGYGVSVSLQPRYTTVSILLVISSIQLWRLLIIYKNKSVSDSVNIRTVFYFLFGLLTAIFIANSTAAIAEGRNVWLRETSGKTCIEVINYLDKSIDELPDSCLHTIVNDYFRDVLRPSITTLNRLGFRSSPKDITFTKKTIKTHGNIDLPPTRDKPLTLPKNLSVKLSGWTTLPDGREQPRVVLFSYGDKKSFFANAVVKLPRPDIGRMLKSGRYSRIGWDRFGWEVNIPGNSLPVGETVIKAWVYDRDSKQFIKLDGNPKVKVINE